MACFRHPLFDVIQRLTMSISFTNRKNDGKSKHTTKKNAQFNNKITLAGKNQSPRNVNSYFFNLCVSCYFNIKSRFALTKNVR